MIYTPEKSFVLIFSIYSNIKDNVHFKFVGISYVFDT